MQLRVRSNGSLLWNFNYREPVTKKRINIGFGTYPELSLANARKKAVEARNLLAQGIDPKVQRNTLNEAKRAETEHTFENVATAWFELKGRKRSFLSVRYWRSCRSRPASFGRQSPSAHRPVSLQASLSPR